MAIYTLTAAQLNGQGILNSFVIPAGSSFDPDAQAFITATGITNSTQQNAINQLVLDFKSYNLWSSMNAIYPFVGGTATTHKYNLKDPRDLDAAYRLTFNGGWTHSTNGAQANGTNGYADTNLNAATVLSNASYNYSVYSRTQLAGNYVNFMGASNGNDAPNPEDPPIYEGSITLLNLSILTDINIYYDVDQAVYKVYDSSITTGMFNVNNDAGAITLYKNGVNQTLTGGNVAVYLPNANIYLAANNSKFNGVDGPAGFYGIQYGFTTISSKLTGTQASNLYTAVQAFQTTLGRQV